MALTSVIRAVRGKEAATKTPTGYCANIFPKALAYQCHAEEELDAIAEELNNRPRQTLSWMTPLERFAQVLQ
jgi:IS30 family transposase